MPMLMLGLLMRMPMLILMVSISLSGIQHGHLGKRASGEVEERKRSDTPSRLFSKYFGKPFLFYHQNDTPQ